MKSRSTVIVRTHGPIKGQRTDEVFEADFQGRMFRVSMRHYVDDDVLDSELTSTADQWGTVTDVHRQFRAGAGGVVAMDRDLRQEPVYLEGTLAGSADYSDLTEVDVRRVIDPS